MSLNPEQVDIFLNFVRDFYVGRDPGHNFAHIRRMIGRLDFLAEGLSEPNCPRLLFLACFHGLNALLQDDQAFKGKTVSFLQQQGWDDLAIEEALVHLESHLCDPQTVEDCMVHDANYMELLGAFGIAKAFTTGGARGQEYEETIRIYQGFLDRVSFRTPAGRRFAQENIGFTRGFMTRLQKELGLEKNDDQNATHK